MSISYIDIHAHAYETYFGEDTKDIIERAEHNKVAIINIGTNIETSRLCVLTAEQYTDVHPHLYSIVGIHPSVVSDFFDNGKDEGVDGDSNKKINVDEIRSSIASNLNELDILIGRHLFRKAGRGKIVGIGECGIDLFRVTPEKKGVIFELQKELFIGQIELARKYDLPLMIHARESYNEILTILDENFILKGLELRGNIHFFAGTDEEARMFLERGFTVSFTGVITFASQYDEVLRALPTDKVMSETDCPYVAPSPYRGKRNEPSYVIEVVKKMAEIRGQEIETLMPILLSNAEKMFGFNLQSY